MKYNILGSVFSLCVLFGLVFSPQFAVSNELTETLVVQFLGQGERLTVDDVKKFPKKIRERLEKLIENEDEDGPYCLKVPMFDPETGNRIGFGIDCLDNVDGRSNPPQTTLMDTAFFKFPGKGWIVAEADVTVSPHIAGSNPDIATTGATPTENDIVAGTGRFKNAKGGVRLSGLVNLNNFPDDMGFNCLFMLTLTEL